MHYRSKKLNSATHPGVRGVLGNKNSKYIIPQLLCCLFGMMSMFPAKAAEITPPDIAAAARANAEQNQQVQQQRDAQQREADLQAPAVRSAIATFDGYPLLPVETPCFRISTFALDVPTTLPNTVRSKGASALPLDPFAFAREWLDHYKGQCVGKTGIDTLTKGLQQAILSRGYVTTRVLVPQQDLSGGTLPCTLR